MAAFGDPPRRNARCLRCNSLERHRLLWLYLSRRTEILKRPTRLLHIAPEICLENRLRSFSGIDYLSGDLNADWVDLRFDLTDASLPDQTFDAVICSHVLEHVADDLEAMREVRRMLRVTGSAFFMVPQYPNLERTLENPNVTDPMERKRLFGQSDHARKYGSDLHDRLSEAGFRVSKVDFAAELGEAEVLRYSVRERTIDGSPYAGSVIWHCWRTK